VQLSSEEVCRIEAGDRSLSASELARFAHALEIPANWFLTSSPPSVVSLRDERPEGPAVALLDLLLEGLARDVEFLQEVGALPMPVEREPLKPPQGYEDAERAAKTVRSWLETGDRPLHDLATHAESLGLYTLSLALPEGEPDGAYVALERSGVALVNGRADAGRRRFTLAHELGHHVFQDKYSTDWVGGGGGARTEKLINAFAVHLLFPRASVVARWHELGGPKAPRTAAVVLAVDYRVSWTVACAQLSRFGVVDAPTYGSMKAAPPTRADYLQLASTVVEELQPPSVPPRFAEAVLAAYRGHKLSADRAVEMLRGVVVRDELPVPDRVPLQAYLRDLEPA